MSKHSLLLKDGTYHVITEEEIATYKTAFPGLDIEQQIREMALWCADPAKKRKTRRGSPTFIRGWLSSQHKDKCMPRMARSQNTRGLSVEHQLNDRSWAYE